MPKAKGMVTASDGTDATQPMRLCLTQELLTLQKEELVYVTEEISNGCPSDSRERTVKIIRQQFGGLGLSIKGGAEHKLPILVSRIFKNQAAEKAGRLFVGDAILRVNETSLEGCHHDEAVEILRTAGSEVTLTVRHYRAAAPFLKASLQEYIPDDPHTSPTLRIEEKEDLERLENNNGNTESEQSPLRLEKRWKDSISVQLLMSYITRCILGTNRLRINAFEVYNMDFSKSAIIHCDDDDSVNQWVQAISSRISQLTNTQMEMFNKLLPPADQVLYMGWVNCNYGDESRPCFLGIKGADVCLFQKPPINKVQWSMAQKSYKVYQTTLKPLRENDHMDDKCHWLLLQTASNDPSYLSVNSASELSSIEAAWHRATYNSVSRLGSQTFSVMCRGKAAALTLDWNLGFALYDTEAKYYLWKYRFSQLKGSADDGRRRLKLHFQDFDTREIETKELECSQLRSLLFCMHAFLTAKVVSVDPNFVCSS